MTGKRRLGSVGNGHVMDRARFLLDTELFRHVSPELVRLTSEQMDVERAEAGDVIFEEGAKGDAVYIVVEGRVALRSRNIYLMSRGAGDCFGEFALIDEAPRSATAVAETEVELLRWTRAAFLDSLSQHRELARATFTMLTGKLRDGVGRQVEVRRDLERAREVQMAMMPKENLTTRRLHAAGTCRPAADVGGDFFDFFSLDENRTAAILADVMGHGFYAGLLVAMAKSCVHTQVSADAAPGAVMRALNKTIALSVDSGLLTTCVYARFDAERERLEYTNAGHVAPFVLRASGGELERLESTDMLLGVPGCEDAEFSVAETAFAPGDSLLLFSDGISEAPSASGAEFGEARLGDVLARNAEKSPESIRDAVLEELDRHCAGTEQQDDVTLVVAQRASIASSG